MPGRRGRLPSVRLRVSLPGRPAKRRIYRGPRYPLLALFHPCRMPVRRQMGRRGTKRAKRTQFRKKFQVGSVKCPANRAKRTQFRQPGRGRRHKERPSGPRHPIIPRFHPSRIPIPGWRPRGKRAKQSQFPPVRIKAKLVIDPYFARADEGEVPCGTAVRRIPPNKANGRRTRSGLTCAAERFRPLFRRQCGVRGLR
jgi:hypothetical protein